MHYDADSLPDAAAWTAATPDARRVAIAEHHADFDDLLHQDARAQGPRGQHAHLGLHAVVEDHIAAGSPAATGAAVDRLVRDGLRRHAAVHLVGEAIQRALVAAMSRGRPLDDAQLTAALSALDAAGWLATRMRAHDDESRP